MYRRAVTINPIPRRFVNASSSLTISTYDGGGELTHPSVIDFGSGNSLLGYRFLLCVTPYPNNDNSKENPCVYGSNDKTTWVVPAGVTNPIVAVPGSGYNSDPIIFWDTNLNKLKIIYRVSDTSNNDTIRSIESSNGITWTNDVLLLSFPSTDRAVSPALVINPATGQYMLYVVKISGSINFLEKYSSTDGYVFTKVGKVSFNVPRSYKLWHLEMHIFRDHIIGLMDAQVIGDESNKAVLLYFESIDQYGGNGFQCHVEPILTVGANGQFDQTTLYKASLLNVDGVWTLWYTGITYSNPVFTNKLGYTTAIKI